MRLIDADELTKDIEYSADIGGVLGKVVEYVKYYAKYMVASAPTIEERKTGRWIEMWDKNDPYTSSRGRCSICGRESDRPLGDYCKWCGADMMSLPRPYKEGTNNQITACPMCPDCPDNCPLGEDMRGDDHADD